MSKTLTENIFLSRLSVILIIYKYIISQVKSVLNES